MKLLILGATGAMGRYLTKRAVEAGDTVDAVALNEMASESPNLRYIKTKDARDPAFVDSILSGGGYDAVVDFMIYNSISFRKVYKKYLAHSGRYCYLSSCRVFADTENPIREDSPRLLDVTTDRALLFSDDYCMHKARGEDTLRADRSKNWTILRPSTTYSTGRCQLVTLEKPAILRCLKSGEPVLLPEKAKDIPASLTWGGDVAEMIYRLLLNPDAAGEDFNVTTSEALTWGEIAGIYEDLMGLSCRWVSEEEYQLFRNPSFDPVNNPEAVWQLRYARLFRRVYDNSKMLAATGLSQSSFLSLREGLSRELPSLIN